MKKYILTLGIILGLFSSSCDKGFEELNENPFFPTQTDIGPLFNTVISSLRLGWNEQFYLHNEISFKGLKRENIRSIFHIKIQPFRSKLKIYKLNVIRIIRYREC